MTYRNSRGKAITIVDGLGFQDQAEKMGWGHIMVGLECQVGEFSLDNLRNDKSFHSRKQNIGRVLSGRGERQLAEIGSYYNVHVTGNEGPGVYYSYCVM